MENKEVTVEEILEKGFDSEVEVEETRENLGWAILSNSFLFITN